MRTATFLESNGARMGRWALMVAALIVGTASARETGELIGFINAYRSAPQTCEGNSIAASGPLAPDPALAGVRIASGGRLLDALKERGYQAAEAQAITVSGLAGAGAVMKSIKQRYCRPLLSPRYAEIGVSRDADTWRIVLARPLLSPALGEWRVAGKEILRMTNAARAEPRTCGNRRFSAAPPLAWSADLAAAALAHSRDMANRNDFRHTGGDGSQVGDRATRERYQWRRVGENISTGQGSPEQTMSAWLSSPGHCTNIMTQDFAEMGAAYAVNPTSDTAIYWTQVFGTPR